MRLILTLTLTLALNFHDTTARAATVTDDTVEPGAGENDYGIESALSVQHNEAQQLLPGDDFAMPEQPVSGKSSAKLSPVAEWIAQTDISGAPLFDTKQIAISNQAYFRAEAGAADNSPKLVQVPLPPSIAPLAGLLLMLFCLGNSTQRRSVTPYSRNASPLRKSRFGASRKAPC